MRVCELSFTSGVSVWFAEHGLADLKDKIIRTPLDPVETKCTSHFFLKKMLYRDQLVHVFECLFLARFAPAHDVHG